MASMVTMHPLSSSIPSSRGMAVISLDLSSVFTCPRVRVLAEAQALTRWMACLPALLSWERRTVLPSMATTSPGSNSATDWLHSIKHSIKHSWNRSGSKRENTSPKVSCDGMPLGQFQEAAEPLLPALAKHLHMDPRVSTAGNGANGDGNDVQQLVSLAPVNPRILQSLETLHDISTLPFSHHTATPLPSLLSHLQPSLTPMTRLP